MEKIKKLKNCKMHILFIFVLWIASIMLCYVFTYGEYAFGDAGDYWNMGASLWNDGNFSILNIDGFRGYIYPLYLGICHKLLGGKLGFVILNSLIISLYFAVVIPKLHKCQLDSRRKYFSCILMYVLYNIFFYGLVIYPLTDMFAIVLCSVAVLVEHKLEKSKGIKSIFFGVLLGIIVYCTYNVRTIYMFSGIYIFFCLLFFIWKNQENFRNKLAILSSYLLGAIIASVPQIYINYAHFGQVSLKVNTRGLLLSQMTWGIRYQRYETLMAMSKAHPYPQVYFMDATGNSLLERAGVEVFECWADYFKFVLKYPLDVAGIYVRHLFNMLFPCYPEQYITDLRDNKYIYVFVSITCIFLFGIAVFKKYINQNFFRNYIALLVPLCCILPGAVESRYFAVLFIIIIGTLCYSLDWNKMRSYVIENKIEAAALYIIFGGILIAMWGNMLASEYTGVIFFQG